MLNEFSRTELLLGEDGVRRLADSHVCVFGIGGVGSHCTEALARSGIGTLTLVDNDTVSLTNLNRQSIAFHSTIGQYKTQVMKRRILDINPQAQVNTLETFVLEEEIKTILDQKPDYVIDAIDTVAAKLALAQEAAARQIPLISCMGTGNKLDPSAFEIADIYETSVCPLCKVMRRECRKRGIESLKVLYSKEEPIHPESSQTDAKIGQRETKGSAGRPAPGSVSFVPPVAGILIAGYVIRALTGICV